MVEGVEGDFVVVVVVVVGGGGGGKGVDFGGEIGEEAEFVEGEGIEGEVDEVLVGFGEEGG